MSGVLVVGDAGPLALAGLDGAEADPHLVVALDAAAAPAGLDVPLVRWWRGPAPAGGPAAGVEHVIAPSGPGLWAAAPWPVHPQVFALDAPPAGRVLVVDASDPRRTAVVGELERRGIEATGAPWLTLEALAGADVVVHGAGPAAALPGDAPAVLAAGRLLIANPDPAFGLLAGIDHLRAEGPAPAADLVEAVLAAPDAFAAIRRHGLLTAARHRAQDVYARLEAELA